MPKMIIPVAKKIFVCDDVVVDPESSKTSALNVWDTCHVRDGNFPFVLGKLCVFGSFRGGLGDIPLHVEIVRAETGAVYGKSKELILACRDRTKRYDARLMFVNVMFPLPGAYVVELYCNRVFVDDQPIQVVSDHS